MNVAEVFRLMIELNCYGARGQVPATHLKTKRETTPYMCVALKTGLYSHQISEEEFDAANLAIQDYLAIVSPSTAGTEETMPTALFMSIRDYRKTQLFGLGFHFNENFDSLTQLAVNIYSDWEHRPMSAEAIHNRFHANQINKGI